MNNRDDAHRKEPLKIRQADSSGLRVFALHHDGFWRDLLVLTCGVGLFFCVLLGGRPLATPDEGRYAEIPREMLTTGDFVTPRLNGFVYFEKPPLLYWAVAGAMKVGGGSPGAARSIPALAALLGVLAVYFYGRRALRRRSAAIASVALATSLLYYVFSRFLLIDMLQTTWMTIAFLSYYDAYHRPPGWGRRLGHWIFAGALGLGVLTKGLMILAVVGPTLVLWLTLTRGWRGIFPAYIPSSLVLFLVIALPWHWMVAERHPGFLDFYFIHEHFERYTSTVHGRCQGLWFGVVVVLIGLFPWTPFLITAAKNFRTQLTRDNPCVFYLLWAGFVLLFFSVSRSQLIPYFLPVLPPLCLWIGARLAPLWRERGVIRGPLVLLTGIVAMLASLSFCYFEHSLFGAVLMTVAVVAFVGRYAAPRVVLPVLLVPVSVCCLLLNPVGAEIQEEYRPSVKPIVERLKAILPAGTPLIAYRAYFQDLPFYWGQTVPVYDWRGELNYGINAEKPDAFLGTQERFEALWRGPALCCAITKPAKLDAFRERHGDLPQVEVSRGAAHVVFCNQPPEENKL